MGSAQPEHDYFELSEEIVALKCVLDDALDDLAEQTGASRFKKCGRCSKEYDEESKKGCKKHQAYFLGGSILEGRWVCCRQQKEDSPGCVDAEHTEVKYVWYLNPNYGTHSWEPETVLKK